MARMQRATIEEAATSLGVAQSVIELQIKSGSLVPCQDPLFRRCVWIRESHKPKPKRTAKAKLTKDLGLPDLASSTGAIGLPPEAAALLEIQPEIAAPKPKRKARATPKKDMPAEDLVKPGQAKPDEETGMLRDTIAMLKAELEIRDEQLDLLGVQLEFSRQEVRKLRPLLGGQLELRSKEIENLQLLLGSIQSSESAHKTELCERPPSLVAVAAAGQPAGEEAPGTVARPLDLVPPTLEARAGYLTILGRSLLGRSFRPFVGLMCLDFSLPLFH